MKESAVETREVADTSIVFLSSSHSLVLDGSYFAVRYLALLAVEF